MAEYGYARVSTLDQDVRAQLDALSAAGVPAENIHSEQVSGTRAERPELAAVLARLKPGDRLTVWRLDRLGRSMPHLVATVEDLAARGVAVRSLTEQLDTTTATGRLMLGLFATLAQFERDLTIERTRAGLAAARAAGKPIGRPSPIHPDQAAHMRQLAAEGKSYRDIARLTGRSKAAVGRVLRGEIPALAPELPLTAGG